MALETGYKAKQAADGTWTVFDVPIFAAHTHPKHGEFTLAWLQAAVQRAALRAREDYLAPLHVKHHHEPGVEVKGAGRFLPTRVAMLPYNGVMTPVVFANLIGIRPEAYERVRKGELPYRSVEIHPQHIDVKFAEIDSVALLDDEVPFFRLPMLRVIDEEPLSGVQFTAGSPVVACQWNSLGSTAVLLRFGEELGSKLRSLRKEKGLEVDEMASRVSAALPGGDIKGSTVSQIEGGGIQTPSAPVLAAFAKVLGVSVASLEELFDEDKQDVGRFVTPGSSNMAGDNPTGTPAPGATPAPDSGTPPDGGSGTDAMLQQILELLQKLAGGLQGQGDDPKPDNDEPEDAMRRAAPVEVGVTMRTAQPSTAQGGTPFQVTADPARDALVAQFKDVSARVDKFETKERLDTRGVSLRTAGMGEKQIAEFRAYATKHGEAKAMAYADAMQSYGPQDPPPTWSQGSPSPQADPPEVAKFAEVGPEALLEARSCYASWQRGNVADMSAEDYIASNMDAAKFVAAGSK